MSATPGSNPPAPSREDRLRSPLLLLIGALCAGAVVVIVAILAGGRLDETGAKALLSAVALILCALAGLACSSLARVRPSLAWLAALGTGAATAAFGGSLLAIWLAEDHEGLAQVFGVLAVTSVALANCCMLLRRDPRGEGAAGVVRSATVGLTVLLGALSIIEIAGDHRDVGVKPLGVLAVLLVLGMVLLPLVGRADPGRGRSSAQGPPQQLP
jgi:hypothetical protein